MRLRNSLVAAAGALLITLAVPNSAHAATGDFLYKVGNGTPAGVADPESGTCINVPGASESHPAFAPHNLTTSTATVFVESDCDGDVFYVMNPGKKLGDRLKFRSVLFS
ncbi:hypothetical protein [Kitasatospora purpeofusca]|uniref:hypothetical protein n=1 Tax=Kitasatospora purpeofusca TaxID=67352 RepID=UPI002A59AF46|nr:hypothetical protein [Kitasatospora purpeofusca]MDY0816598.1 hypothetical protein [Kitasatospora purpeofusca]